MGDSERRKNSPFDVFVDRRMCYVLQDLTEQERASRAISPRSKTGGVASITAHRRQIHRPTGPASLRMHLVFVAGTLIVIIVAVERRGHSEHVLDRDGLLVCTVVLE